MNQNAETPDILTPDERKAVDALADAWNIFLRLPKLHPADDNAMMLAINAAQNIIMSRPILRHDGWQPGKPLVDYDFDVEKAPQDG